MKHSFVLCRQPWHALCFAPPSEVLVRLPSQRDKVHGCTVKSKKMNAYYSHVSSHCKTLTDCESSRNTNHHQPSLTQVISWCSIHYNPFRNQCKATHLAEASSNMSDLSQQRRQVRFVARSWMELEGMCPTATSN